MDVMTPRQRHKAMAHNRGRTRPERALASGLWSRGLRYLTHGGYRSVTGQRLHGNPDLVFRARRIVVFVDGCFWHGCMECRKHLGLSGGFWVGKVEATKERDRRVTSQLEDSGWTVLRIPEHDLKTKAALEETLDRLVPLIGVAKRNKAVLGLGGDGVHPAVT